MRITWDATNGIIAAAIKPEILAAAAESGCIGMNLGLESGNPEILREIRKPGTVDNFRRAKNLLDEYPQIFVKGFLIIGFPEETIAQMADTVSLSSELAFHWYPLQILTPLPNTDITDSMLEQGLISEEEITPGFLGEAAGSKSKGGGSLRRREQEEEKKARHFENFFETRSDNDCLNAEELRDMWFIVDYKVNYEKLLNINNPIKVRNISLMLKQITDEYTQNNSLGNLFMAVLEQKLGNHNKSQRRLDLAEKYLSTSAYWQKRYDVLNINEVISQVKSRSFVDSELP
ncbi:MAG: radical SAM protein [Flavobacteriales bacterium]|nr:radical SAM protein [Flavobacteriales bacterium]